jgi:sugar lactone lactonase YvrE
VGKIAAGTGLVSIIAGTGVCGFSGDGGPATSAQLNGPTGLALAPDGGLAIVDSDNCRIRKVDLSAGTITTVAGNGVCGFSGDGSSATAASLGTYDASVISPFVWSDLAYDAHGNLYIADIFNCRIREVSVTGKITTVAGSGPSGFPCGDFAGDGGDATAARLSSPVGVAVNRGGDIFVADLDNCRIRKVDGSTHVLTTVAGDGSCISAGDGGAATAAGLANPRGLAMDAEGALYVSEFRFVGVGTTNCDIRRIDPDDGVIARVAGSDTCGFTGDGGHATAAQINTPADIALSCDGNVAFAEPLNGDIRVVAGISVGGPAPDPNSDGIGYVCD